MAKPKHDRWNNYTRQASLSSDALPSAKLRSKPSHLLSRSSHRFPSPAVLSALAVIATAPTVVACSPIPPSLPTPPPTFLCPFIERDNADPSSNIFVLLSPPTTTPSCSTPSPTPSPTPPPSYNIIADKYVEGSDSLWRKTDAWILYGSTCCSSPVTPNMQLQPSPPPTPIPSSSSSPTTASFDTSSLPAGWNEASSPSSSTESTTILALAIALAGSICVFMIGCLVWRRRKKRTKDIERKLGKKLSANNDSQDNVQEKDARGKIRMWAKASARWKSNVRQSARRRRKNPLASSVANRPLSPTLCGSNVSTVAPSILSRRRSTVTEAPNDATGPSNVQNDPPRPVSPPTYGASLVPRFSGLSPSSAVSDPNSTSPPDRPHPTEPSNHPSFIENEPLPYIPRNDVHVATDDKAQLARIRELASSPPDMSDTASASAMQSVSAPEWHEVEDDLENLGIDLSELPMSFYNFALPPSFPPPPSKTDIRFEYLDNHPLRYDGSDDILVLPSTPRQSESSLGASPSAPPIDYPALEPSAPSLEGEDDLFQDWDGASSYVPEVSISAAQDSTPGVTTLSTASTVSSTSSTSFPPARQSSARDSILPQYHP